MRPFTVMFQQMNHCGNPSGYGDSIECPLAFNEAIGQSPGRYGVPVLLNAAPALDFPDPGGIGLMF